MSTILTLACILIPYCSVRAYAPPCIYGTTNQPSECDPNRIKKCSEFNAIEAHIIEKDVDNDCGQSPKVNDAVYGKIENDYVVQFDGRNGECLAIRMQAGECWGDHPNTTGNYDCLGRCGGSCGSTSWCNRWGPDCLKHDVCSWYYGSTDGARNVDCGDEFYHAVNDYLASCWGKCKGPRDSCSMVSADTMFAEQMSQILILSIALLLLCGCFCSMDRNAKTEHVTV